MSGVLQVIFREAIERRETKWVGIACKRCECGRSLQVGIIPEGETGWKAILAVDDDRKEKPFPSADGMLDEVEGIITSRGWLLEMPS